MQNDHRFLAMFMIYMIVDLIVWVPTDRWIERRVQTDSILHFFRRAFCRDFCVSTAAFFRLTESGQIACDEVVNTLCIYFSIDSTIFKCPIFGWFSSSWVWRKIFGSSAGKRLILQFYTFFKARFTENLTIVDSTRTEAFPIYRVTNSNGEFIDVNQDPHLPKVRNCRNQLIIWYF